MNGSIQWIGRSESSHVTTRAANAAISLCVGSVLLIAATRVQIPFWPVPLNMQTFVVLCLGLVYGPALGTATVAAFLAQGFIGLPVFATGGGPAYFAGPTGGYLVGFLAAAWVAGWLAQRGWTRRLSTAVAAAFIGNAAVYVLGISWLTVLLGDVGRAVALGLTPFLLGAALKILGAALLGWGYARWLAR